MVELNDRTIPYEILLRFGDDGDVQGAHYIERRIVEIDGERLKDELGPALPVALVAGGGRAVLADVLGEAFLAALVTADGLAEALKQKESDVEALAAGKAEAEAQRDQLAGLIADRDQVNRDK